MYGDQLRFINSGKKAFWSIKWVIHTNWYKNKLKIIQMNHEIRLNQLFTLKIVKKVLKKIKPDGKNKVCLLKYWKNDDYIPILLYASWARNLSKGQYSLLR
jgi:hypothetical protein